MELDKALGALRDGDTLVVTTLDRLGRSTVNMLTLADDIKDKGARGRRAELWWWGRGHQHAQVRYGYLLSWLPWGRWSWRSCRRGLTMPEGSDVRLARISVDAKPNSHTARTRGHLIDSGQPAAQVARDMGMSRATLYRRMEALSLATKSGK